jgi:predicted enzyme related to lactoylglutathione lyase
MHRILVRSICLDFPDESHDSARDFWATAFATPTRPAKHFAQYTVFEHPASLSNVFVQHIGEGGPRVHFDIESDDQPAEVGRLVGAGAQIVAEQQDASQTMGDWTILRDPAGVLFCVVKADVDDDFEAKAVSVG